MGVSGNVNRKRLRDGKLHERHGALVEDCGEEDIVIQKKPKCNKKGQEEEQKSNANSSGKQVLKSSQNSSNGNLLNSNKKQWLNPVSSKNGHVFHPKSSKKGQDLKLKSSKNGQQRPSKRRKERMETAVSKAPTSDSADVDTHKVKQDEAEGEVFRDPPKKEAGPLPVYLTNLEAGVQKIDIRRFFKGCTIDNIHLGIDKRTSRFYGYGRVDFCDEKSREKAIKMDQKQLLGRPIKISCTVPQGI